MIPSVHQEFTDQACEGKESLSGDTEKFIDAINLLTKRVEDDLYSNHCESVVY